MIKETSDYDIFKKHVHNRPLVEGNILKILKSIQFKNLLKYRPILIDKDYRVIDGQHRLEAAKRLCISVFYEMKTDVEHVDIKLLNDNQKGYA